MKTNCPERIRLTYLYRFGRYVQSASKESVLHLFSTFLVLFKPTRRGIELRRFSVLSGTTFCHSSAKSFLSMFLQLIVLFMIKSNYQL